MNDHLDALKSAHAAATAEITSAADSARALLDGDIAALRAAAAPPPDRMPLIADVPVDELPPYVPPAVTPSAAALIPDTPVVDVPPPAAFDDAPLWQS